MTSQLGPSQSNTDPPSFSHQDIELTNKRKTQTASNPPQLKSILSSLFVPNFLFSVFSAKLTTSLLCHCVVFSISDLFYLSYLQFILSSYLSIIFGAVVCFLLFIFGLMIFFFVSTMLIGFSSSLVLFPAINWIFHRNANGSPTGQRETWS